MEDADAKLDSADPAEVEEAVRRVLVAPPAGGRGGERKPNPGNWRHFAFVH